MRRVRSGFWVALIIGLLVTAHAYWDFLESRRLRVRLEAVKASAVQTPLTMASRPARAAADSDRFYRAASVLASGLLPPASPEADFQLRQAIQKGNWTADLTTVLRARIEGQRDALALIDRAAALPFDGFRAGWRRTYGGDAYIALSRLCEMRAVDRTLSGDGDGAFDSLYSDVRLERVTMRVPQFAGLAFVVERAKPSEAARARLAGALVEIDRDDRLQQSLLRLRAQLLESIPPDARLSVVAAPWMRHMVTSQLDTFAELIDAAGRPQPERVSAIKAVGRWPIFFATANPQSRLLLESWTNGIVSEMERVRCARRLVAGDAGACAL